MGEKIAMVLNVGVGNRAPFAGESQSIFGSLLIHVSCCAVYVEQPLGSFHLFRSI